MELVISGHNQINRNAQIFSHGQSFTSLVYIFKISKHSISVTVSEVCEAFIAALKRVREGENNIYCMRELNYLFCKFLD
jgi:hypothetical protein